MFRVDQGSSIELLKTFINIITFWTEEHDRIYVEHLLCYSLHNNQVKSKDSD